MATRIAGFVYALSTGLPVAGVTVTPRASDGSVGSTGTTNGGGYVSIAGLSDKIWTGTVANAAQVFSPVTMGESEIVDDLHGQRNTLNAHDFAQLRGKAVAGQINSETATASHVLTADGLGNATWAAGGAGVGTHALLDSTIHTDTTTGTVARGDLITGQTATPEWTRLAIGSSGTFLRSDGTDCAWTAIVDADVPNTITLDNITQITTRNHASLQNFDASDDHAQYAKIAGRSGGQTIIGGTASGNDLELRSTSHATKGTIFLGNSGSPTVANVDEATAVITAERFVSSIGTGTAPFGVSSTTKVTNLNADLLDGLDSTGFALASHSHAASDITSGTLAVARGGTNIGSYTGGDIIYATGPTVLALLGIGSSGQVLTVSGGVPAWATIGSTINLNDLADVDTTGVANGDFLQFNGTNWVDFDLLDTANSWGANQTLATTIQLRLGDSDQRILGTTATKTLDIVSAGTAGTIALSATDSTGVISLDARTINLNTASTTRLTVTTAAATVSSAFALRFGTSNQRIFGTSPQLDLVCDAASSVLNLTSSGTSGEINLQGTSNVSVRIASTDEYFYFTRAASGSNYVSQLWFRAYDNGTTAMDDAGRMQGFVTFDGMATTNWRMSTFVDTTYEMWRLNIEVVEEFTTTYTAKLFPAEIANVTWTYGLSGSTQAFGGSGTITATSSLALLSGGCDLFLGSAANTLTSTQNLTFGCSSTSPRTLTLDNIGVGDFTLNIVSSGYFSFSESTASLTFATTRQCRFRDATTYIYSSATNTLDLVISSTSRAVLTSTALTLGTGVGLVAPNVTDSALTSGRVVLASTGGLLADDSDLTFSGSTLTATNVTVTTDLQIGGVIKDGTGQTALDLVDTGAANYFRLYNSATGNPIKLWAHGSDTNVGMTLATRGVGGFLFQDGSGVNILTVSPVSSGVTYLTIANATTGNPPTIGAVGEANVGITVQTTGTGVLTLQAAGSTKVLQGTTLGNAVFQLVSTATNDDPTEVVYQNRVATTDATVTTLHTFTVPSTTTYVIESTVVARRTGGSSGTAEDGAGYRIIATYKNVSGTATLIGSVTTLYSAESQAGWDCTYSLSGATVLLRVTGAASNNVTWHSTSRVWSVGS